MLITFVVIILGYGLLKFLAPLLFVVIVESLSNIDDEHF